MLLKIKLILTINVLLCFSALASYGQYRLEGLDLDGDIASWYDEAIGMERTGLLHGEFFLTQNKASKSHPYFRENSWEGGSLIFNKQKYSNVFLKYDIRRDVLIIENTSDMGASNQPLMVRQTAIQAFTIFGFDFRYLTAGECPGKRPGFYNILYQGKNLELMVKRRKEESYDQNRNYSYYEENRFFLAYDGVFYRISKKPSFLKVFKNIKSDIRHYAKENGLSISTANEKDLIAITRFCDNLIGSK